MYIIQLVEEPVETVGLPLIAVGLVLHAGFTEPWLPGPPRPGVTSLHEAAQVSCKIPLAEIVCEIISSYLS